MKLKQMKLNRIALAVAAIAGTPSAFALTPAQVDNATVKLWITGASAPTRSVFEGFRTLCRDSNANGFPDDLHVYNAGSGTGLPGASSTGNFFAYACTIRTDATLGSISGDKVVLYHTVDGGSFNAYTPHLRIAGDTNPEIPLGLARTPDVQGLGGGCAATIDNGGVIDTATVPVYASCGSALQNFSIGQAHRTDNNGVAPANVFDNPTVPEGGFSDTEYAMNRANLNITTALAAIGADAPTNIGQAFGLGVSYQLYFKLQQNEVLSGKLAATCTDTETSAAPNFTPDCQPSVSTATYTKLVDSGTGPDQNASIFGAGATEYVHNCRRANTSGTQSTSNLWFLDAPCAAGSLRPDLTPLAGAFSTNSAPAFIEYNGDFGDGRLRVYANSGSGDVKGCLNTNTTTEYRIGWISMENTPAPTATADRWAFVKLDGSSPNNFGSAADPDQRKNAIAASYKAWYELVAFTASTADSEGVATIAAINKALGTPTVTNLKGLFLTSAAGASGDNVSAFSRGSNSCALIH